MIIKKLNNLYEQAYPRNLVSIAITDDASKDKTRQLASEWAATHPDAQVTIIPHSSHTGKMPMVLDILKTLDAEDELMILTDVDAFCYENNALSNITRYFSDPTVAAASCSIQYGTSDHAPTEHVYRDFYNVIRVGESKIYSTPNHNGQFQALRLSTLREIGVPDFVGIDDSAIGSFFAFAGLRAIQVDDVKVWEPAGENMFRRKTRRANRLMMNLMNTKRCSIERGLYKRTRFEGIWKMEYWLHLINPWLLVAGAALILLAPLTGDPSNLTLITLLIGLVSLIIPICRVWIMQQFYLITARIRGIRTRDVSWKK